MLCKMLQKLFASMAGNVLRVVLHTFGQTNFGDATSLGLVSLLPNTPVGIEHLSRSHHCPPAPPWRDRANANSWLILLAGRAACPRTRSTWSTRRRGPGRRADGPSADRAVRWGGRTAR